MGIENRVKRRYSPPYWGFEKAMILARADKHGKLNKAVVPINASLRRYERRHRNEPLGDVWLTVARLFFERMERL